MSPKFLSWDSVCKTSLPKIEQNARRKLFQSRNDQLSTELDKEDVPQLYLWKHTIKQLEIYRELGRSLVETYF